MCEASNDNFETEGGMSSYDPENDFTLSFVRERGRSLKLWQQCPFVIKVCKLGGNSGIRFLKRKDEIFRRSKPEGSEVIFLLKAPPI